MLLGITCFFLFSSLRMVALGIVAQLMPQWMEFSHIWLMTLVNAGFAGFI